MTSGGSKKRIGRHLESLAELGLSDEQLAVMAVEEAQQTVAAMESHGWEPTGALKRRAASGRRIVEVRRARKADQAEADNAHMRKVVGYVHRHLAHRPDVDVTGTRAGAGRS